MQNRTRIWPKCVLEVEPIPIFLMKFFFSFSCAGRVGSIVVDTAMILFLGGACIGYIVIIGDITTPFLNLLGNWEYNAYAWRIALMALVSVFILWPRCLLKRIDSLR